MSGFGHDQTVLLAMIFIQHFSLFCNSKIFLILTEQLKVIAVSSTSVADPAMGGQGGRPPPH